MICHLCGARYSTKTNLISHMKKHRGETRCPVCDEEFAVMRNVRRHMMRRHDMSRLEVDRITNTRYKKASNWRTLCAAQGQGAEGSAAGGE